MFRQTHLLLLIGLSGLLSWKDADAKLACKYVSKRWAVCGNAKPFTSFTIGFEVRFGKMDATGNLVCNAKSYTGCDALGSDPSVPRTLRQKASAVCRRDFEPGLAAPSAGTAPHSAPDAPSPKADR